MRSLTRVWIVFVWMALLCGAPPARAQLSIEITGAGAQRVPLAVVPFAGEQTLAPGLTAIVLADLERCGMFRGIEVPPLTPQPTESSPVDYVEWRARLADALVLGSVSQLPDGRIEVRFRLFDVVKRVPLGGVAYTLNPQQLRATAHRIADFVYEKLTGERGVFSTRIAYVLKRGTHYELQIADADGMSAESALASFEPIISPAWSPDGKRIAYVSFENKRAIVYVHSLVEGKRQVLANFRGTNAAPAWSPDGTRLAVSLSRDGLSQIYYINSDGSNVRRVTQSAGIDTEPCFSPDGQWLYFTSDRGGSPQIYRMPANGGDAERISFDGSYNATPRISPDGKSLAYISRNEGRFQIALLDLASKQVRMLTDGDRDESPSFSPNGRMILYASEIEGRGVLSAVSADGSVRQRLSVTVGDIREPAWGPFVQ
jgi:TolB protein